MNRAVVGFCPYCGGAGLVCPAHEQNSSELIFVCDECLSVFESIEDLNHRKARALKNRYEELTMQQALELGLDEHLMKFDGKKWISNTSDNESVLPDTPVEKSASHLEALEVIRKHLSELVPKAYVLDAIMKDFERHEDIASEFAFRIRSGQIPDKPVTIRIGEDVFTANSLMRDYKQITTLRDAYSFLAFLREDPQAAISMIKRKFPQKD